jgi:hypothetical protein
LCTYPIFGKSSINIGMEFCDETNCIVSRILKLRCLPQ